MIDRSRRLLVGLVVLAASGLVPLAGASAHAILLESTPANNATVKGPKVDFSFRYNSRVDKKRSRLTLTLPDKSHQVLPIAQDGANDTLTAASELMPGNYTVRWQVLAIDGHITRGDVAFTVAAE